MNSADRYLSFKIILNIYVLCIENCNLNCNELGKLIIKNAIEKGSEDNISCIVILLNDIVN